MIPDPNYFFKRYELLNSSANYFPSFIKSTTCRYCGKTAPETSFNQVTHLIPELLGENNIHTFDECDKCNHRFSGFESNLSIFFRPYITLLGIKGKSNIPMFQSRSVQRNEKTRTTLLHNQDKKIGLHIGDIQDYILHEQNKTFEIVFRKPPYVPVKVYKALVKIGLSLLPQEYDVVNTETFEWLLGDTNELGYINHMFTTTLNDQYFSRPSADLYKAKKIYDRKMEWPDYTLVLFFANQVVQIFLPFTAELKKVHSRNRTLEINLFSEHFNYKAGSATEIKGWNIGIDHSIVHDHRMLFTYQDVIFNSEKNDEDV